MLSGPLTYTSKEGKTTLYGVVSGPGKRGQLNRCMTSALYGRVSEPIILEWITGYIKQYN